MTSWYSNLLTKTSSQISSLKSTLLSSEADGDTEDDTHVCRVLRDFYTEKGRPSPPWLPPDPRAGSNPNASTPQAVYAQSQAGGQRFPGQQAQQGPGAAGFGSLWDNNNTNNGGGGGSNINNSSNGYSNNPNHNGAGGRRPPPLQVHAQSLRAGARNGGMLSPSVPGRADDQGNRMGQTARAGSYPNPGSQTPTLGGGTAQDRLRQRLWGGARTTSPSAQGGPFQPPPSPGAHGGAHGSGENSWTGGDDYFGGATGGRYGGAASRRQGNKRG